MLMRNFFIVTLLIGVSVAGCAHRESKQVAGGEVSAQGKMFLVASEPENSIHVGEARKSDSDGKEITLVGIIGGSSMPFVDGLAAFTIVDPKVPYCPPAEGCPTPWDYCCTQDQVKSNIATVKIVDKDGNVLNEDAKALLGVKELSTVVVTGKASLDQDENLSIAATKIFVRSK